MTRDEYQAKAEEMRSLARSAPDILTRAEYLKLAVSWDELAQGAADLEAKRSRPARKG